MKLTTDDPKFWFEIGAGQYSWDIDVCEIRTKADKKTGEEVEYISRLPHHFGNMAQCFQYAWSCSAKRKLDCTSLREFVLEVRKIEENMLEQIKQLKKREIK